MQDLVEKYEVKSAGDSASAPNLLELPRSQMLVVANKVTVIPLDNITVATHIRHELIKPDVLVKTMGISQEEVDAWRSSGCSVERLLDHHGVGDFVIDDQQLDDYTFRLAKTDFLFVLPEGGDKPYIQILYHADSSSPETRRLEREAIRDHLILLQQKLLQDKGIFVDDVMFSADWNENLYYRDKTSGRITLDSKLMKTMMGDLLNLSDDNPLSEDQDLIVEMTVPSYVIGKQRGSMHADVPLPMNLANNAQAAKELKDTRAQTDGKLMHLRAKMQDYTFGVLRQQERLGALNFDRMKDFVDSQEIQTRSFNREFDALAFRDHPDAILDSADVRFNLSSEPTIHGHTKGLVSYEDSFVVPVEDSAIVVTCHEALTAKFFDCLGEVFLAPGTVLPGVDTVEHGKATFRALDAVFAKAYASQDERNLAQALIAAIRLWQQSAAYQAAQAMLTENKRVQVAGAMSKLLDTEKGVAKFVTLIQDAFGPKKKSLIENVSKLPFQAQCVQLTWGYPLVPPGADHRRYHPLRVSEVEVRLNAEIEKLVLSTDKPCVTAITEAAGKDGDEFKRNPGFTNRLFSGHFNRSLPVDIGLACGNTPASESHVEEIKAAVQCSGLFGELSLHYGFLSTNHRRLIPTVAAAEDASESISCSF